MTLENVKPEHKRLETSALVIGYAMSRLDRNLLQSLEIATWTDAFKRVGATLNVPPNSIKLLRDEFDPVHDNPRRGWADRPMNPSRVRIFDELQNVSDAALIELVRHLLRGDTESTAEALDALSVTTGVPGNAAERLLTGRRAEDFVLSNCQTLLRVPRIQVIDMRESMLGFDFRLDTRPEIVVEVKGLRGPSGGIVFTDREWKEARQRMERFWLVVVGNLDSVPRAEVVTNPAATLDVRCLFERAVRPVWRSTFAVST
jgi:hypothetical protein